MIDRRSDVDLFERLRRAAVLLVVTALAGAVLAIVLGRGGRSEPEYASRSLIVANEWQQRIEGLGRLANAIIETDSFERRLLEADAAAFDRTEADSTFDVVAVLDTVAVWVEAVGPSAELVERRANAAAETLVAELNRLGEGAGKFSVQDPASVARLRTDRAISAPARGMIGGVAALLLAVGTVAAWPRRRVGGPWPALDELVDAADAEASLAGGPEAADDQPNVVWIPLPLEAPGRESVTAGPSTATESYLWGRRSPKLRRSGEATEKGA